MSIWWEEDKLTNYVHKSMRTAEGRVPKKKGKVWSFTKPNPGKKKASIKEQKIKFWIGTKCKICFTH